MSHDDNDDGVIWVNLDHVREHLVPSLEAEGLEWVRCPVRDCGQFTIHETGEFWVCPRHGKTGVVL